MTATDDILASLPATEELLLLVDFDGTISEIVDTPDAAAPVAGAEEVLERLAARARVAVVSGRPIRDLRRRLHTPDGVMLVGGHGAEFAEADGTITSLVDLDAVAPTLDEVEADLRTIIDPQLGWLVERKPASIAVHHRMVADPGIVLLKVRRCLDEHVEAGPGFEVTDGKAVTELRPAGIDKGTVVDRLVAHFPDLHVVVIGDDVTDEDAFVAANAHAATTVVVDDEGRDTAAGHRVRTPSDVLDLLRAVADRT